MTSTPERKLSAADITAAGEALRGSNPWVLLKDAADRGLAGMAAYCSGVYSTWSQYKRDEFDRFAALGSLADAMLKEVPSETVPIEKARERIAGIEEYLARQKTTSVKEEQAHLVEGSDASLYWHFGYMMALKDIFRLSGKQQDQDGKLFQ